jgi:N6-adenosine-specific RNA methylase IME4
VIVVVSDPPWHFGDSLPGKTRGASKQYGCLSVPDIAGEMSPLCEGDNVALFLWRVAAMQEEALHLCRLLGFTVKSEIVWEKLTKNGLPHFGMGRYVRASHEVCLIAVKGRAFPEIRNVRSRFAAPVREHSRKPEEFYRIVESMYPSAEKRECFARTVRTGWSQHGNQLGSLEVAE